MKRGWCWGFILCVVICTTGCGTEEQSRTNSGTGEQLIQHVLEVPGEIEYFDTIAVQDADTLLAVGCQESGMEFWIYNRRENSWLKQYSITELLGEQGLEMQENYSVTTALSEDGTLFVMASQWSEDGREVTGSRYFVISEGTVQEVNIESSNTIYHAEFVDAENIILEDISGNLYGFSFVNNLASETYYSVDENGYFDTYYVTDSKLCVVCPEDLYVYDLESGEKQQPSALEENFINNFSAGNEMEAYAVTKVTQEDDDKIYAFTRDGIAQYTDSDIKHLIDGQNTIMGYSTVTLRNFDKMDNDTFVANFDTGNPKLCIYEFGSDGTTTETVDLTLYVLNNTDEWNQLIAIYRESHPEVQITVQSGMEENSAVTETEVLKKLNTELVNGEGPDLICFDGIEGENYDSQLMDLSELVSQYEDDCFKNIIGAYTEEDGSVYEIPLRFSLPIVMEKNVLSENGSVWERLVEMEEKTDFSAPAAASKNMITLLCRIYMAQWEDEEMPENSLIDFYEMLDGIYTACGSDAYAAAEKAFGSGLDMNEWDLSEIFPGFLEESDLCVSWLVNADGWQRIQAMCSGSEWEYLSVSDRDHRYFAAGNVIGVSRQSEHPEEAMDFLEFALSEAGQQAFGQYSFSVHEKVMEENLLSAEERIYYITNHDGTGGEWPTETLRQDQVNELMEMAREADTPVSNHSIRVNLIQEPFIEYIQGKVTLETAAQNAARKMELYQMEQ